MRRAWPSNGTGALLVAVTVFAALTTPAAATVAADKGTELAPPLVHCGKPNDGPIVIALHAGAFVLPASVAEMERLCGAFAARGFEVVAYQYRVLDWRDAWRGVRALVSRLRRDHDRVLVYGESAGGNLAEMLAVRRLVDGAVAYCGVADMATWQRGNREFWTRKLPMTLRERRRASPLRHVRGAVAPLLLLHSPDDMVVPFAQSARLAARTGAEVRRAEGDHLEDPRALPRAAAWLARRFPPETR